MRLNYVKMPGDVWMKGVMQVSSSKVCLSLAGQWLMQASFCSRQHTKGVMWLHHQVPITAGFTGGNLQHKCEARLGHLYLDP